MKSIALFQIALELILIQLILIEILIAFRNIWNKPHCQYLKNLWKTFTDISVFYCTTIGIIYQTSVTNGMFKSEVRNIEVTFKLTFKPHSLCAKFRIIVTTLIKLNRIQLLSRLKDIFLNKKTESITRCYAPIRCRR